MDINFKDIEDTNFGVFHDLLLEYYRGAEDADTEQEVIDDFIKQLYGMITANSIKGKIVYLKQEYIGFVIWKKDMKDSDFSEIPGYGVILEIGLRKEYRKKGFGEKIVRFAENEMLFEKVEGLYVEAYGMAVKFWEKCGYKNSAKFASNQLPIYLKQI